MAAPSVAPARPRVHLTRCVCAAGLLKAGNVLLLSNATVTMFQGTMRLALDRSGTMQLAAEGTEVEPQARAALMRAATRSDVRPPCGAQTELNMSLIEYDLVTA